MNAKLIESFKTQLLFTSDKNHAAAAAIHDVIFHASDKEWNAKQDEKWMKKYYKGLYILANAGLINLIAK